MSNLDGFRARIAVREAWKRVNGKYPYEEKELTAEQRLQDVDLQMIVNQHEEVEALRAENERLKGALGFATGEIRRYGLNGNEWAGEWIEKATEDALKHMEALAATQQEAQETNE